MKHLSLDANEALSLVEKVDPKYRSVWDSRYQADQVALAQYFLPHRSGKRVLGPTRPRVIKWYCPFAAQKDFPSGHRYCINVYTGCDHKCVYCYAAGYEPQEASSKQRFEELIDKDIHDLEHFNVPAAPIHLSNSTDPFQPLETTFRHTEYALRQILAHRTRFTTVTILTKNPLMPARLGYLDLLKRLEELPADHPRQREFARRKLPGVMVEVSLAFWQDEARAAYDLGAPSVQKRVAGVRALGEAGIPLVLRIDPLFPRSPLSQRPLATMSDFGLAEAQTINDLKSLVRFAREVQVRHVVYSSAKIVQPRGRKLPDTMRAMRSVYERLAAPQKPVFRGGSWRLPEDVAKERIIQPFLRICEHEGVLAKHCKRNLIETP